MWMNWKQSGCRWMGSRVDVNEWEVELMWMNWKQSGCGWMGSRVDVDKWEVEWMKMDGKQSKKLIIYLAYHPQWLSECG